ncbi:teichoic acid D-Ala incorporation-associated protein DltX [Desulfosporosinus youngiae]|uniref:D-Ala-teichoic acid biosynthesis protein n=1 Tax=Desulfosporosinus youngiae DSM 17734 TaxID=768710 RepID=H5XZM3_9FIRM|nr:D-Ala-teichoic acid biosynthesis protein [Desulfosporosinus youngiae DSM 17734]
MKHWTDFITKGSKEWNPALTWLGRAAYYYLILMGLFILYLVQKQQTAAPFIYNNF